jgi:hypothetical protein
MSYARPPVVTRAGQGLKQTPLPSTQAITPVVLDAEIATTVKLGVVKIGNGIAIAPDGTISTSNSNLIGNWTPKLIGSVPGTIALTVYTAKYFKSSQYVYCVFDIKVGAITGGNDSSKITLSGLPFTSLGSSGNTGTITINYYSSFDKNVNFVGGTVPGNSTVANLWFQQNPGQSVSFLTQDDIKTNTCLTGSVSYISLT